VAIFGEVLTTNLLTLEQQQMAKKNRTRIDYMPGQAAFDALGLASEMFPNMRPQALIDKLVITGLVALHWEPPRLYGHNRDAWRLPEQIRTVPKSASV